LRNAIAHGDAVEPERYEYEGNTHLDIAEYRLRQAIKATVIASGYPELALDPYARALYRAIRKHGLGARDETGA
jgi:plasmid replication initiation protein